MALWSMPLLQAPGKSLDPLFLIVNPQGQAQYALRCQHCDELCALLPRGIWSWLFSLLTSAICLVLSIALLVQVWDGTVISYAMGGWPPPWGMRQQMRWELTGHRP